MHVMRREICERRLAQPPMPALPQTKRARFRLIFRIDIQKPRCFSPGFFVPVCRSRCAGGIFSRYDKSNGEILMSLITAGADAPDFSLPNQDGKTVKKDDFAGRYVLLWWYPKADTPG
ncbi:MAG: redoxin domain-containing protein [Rhodospirillaceae bacterium]|nr:MAG: redoxin domain-containing protein [Rhodospirillaceae bacterium]